MSVRHFGEHHDEIVSTAQLLRDEWRRVDPSSGVAQHPASYGETFLDMAKVVVAQRHSLLAANNAAVREAALVEYSDEKAYFGYLARRDAAVREKAIAEVIDWLARQPHSYGAVVRAAEHFGVTPTGEEETQ